MQRYDVAGMPRRRAPGEDAIAGSAVRRVLGWEPRVDRREGLHRTLDCITPSPEGEA